MRDDLFFIHSNIVNGVKIEKKRYMYKDINWNARAICLAGARGTGKTTMLLQYYLERYNNPEKCLYISADNFHIISDGLFNTAKDFFSLGGEALIIDEVHKYPNWSQEIKNIYDTFTQKQILISGSSTLDLTKARYDLSRRVVYHKLPGLSFREFLKFEYDIEVEIHSLDDIIKKQVLISSALLKFGPILKYFKEYLELGYFPYFLEGRADYFNKVIGSVEKVLFEDVGISYNLPQPKIPVLKKLLWLVATSHPFVLNIEGISSDLGVARSTVYNYLDILENAGLFRSVRQENKGAKLIRKPGKLFFDNTNLLYAVAGSIKNEAEKGTVRETFFASQLASKYKLSLGNKADFIVDEKYIFEVGGPSKKEKQISGVENSYLAIDDIEIGHGKRIPLYLFGLLY